MVENNNLKKMAIKATLEEIKERIVEVLAEYPLLDAKEKKLADEQLKELRALKCKKNRQLCLILSREGKEKYR